MTKNKIMLPMDGKTRAVIENIRPELNAGKYPTKTVIGHRVNVSADILIDGHDYLGQRLWTKHQSDKNWNESPMFGQGNDRFGGEFLVENIGFYSFKIEAWVDHFATWQHEVDEKIKAGLKLEVELLVGIGFLNTILKMAKGSDKEDIKKAIAAFNTPTQYEEATWICRSEQLHQWIEKYPIKENVCWSEERKVFADRKEAEFSAWYSIFPRSAARTVGEHGTFQDVEKLLPRIHELGFDVLYLPPVHPIGSTFRKGKNNSTECLPGEPGVPYGIGSSEGGHTAIHSELGTLEEFKHLVEECKKYDMELAMDLAIQCSPDHPWVTEHPDWFKILPDGTIKYAENPPKKYQDIYPINFESEDWQNLWLELKKVIFTWAEWGVKIIRVDNPHTKSFGFWEWVIAETREVYPEMIFLSEAFTKPKVMKQLAKVGFTQSYTYYTWRNSKAELIEYMTELTKTDMKDYFRPNFWPNTHDINPYILQTGHEPLFLIKYFMAATLSSNYGVFGPSYEYLYHEANTPKEEYKNSEKYEIKYWDWEKRNKITHIYTEVNRIRKQNSALQHTNNIEFCEISNDNMLAYIKTHENGNRLLFVVNLEGYNTQSGIVNLPLQKLGKHETEAYLVHDLITGAKYTWQGANNFVSLDPHILPFHLFRIEDIHH
ncbi:alpha-1,4-glucan--maltose-1-phosphate maltosyltransferase [Lacihabitans soyangensis]|uniref:Alpha-1,4-glucan:maltose-1-phosphate maltosyltransferase n=1 Tax=Lacihabitans soyangensis TaxID=869394 RepID=A0AAE3KVT0_9BACT|nr:alpha-1,4-glucan--maltose-1-phosphate maltosyltransferase [Lacihabitans soyangensis]MCP9761680.1 alpha-1,4-glucan--maltose-1-phosphate maltosyltransferase [Lacihabitans soyangensis]